MSSHTGNGEKSLAEIRAVLAAKGLRLIDYKHLNESQLRKLAGEK